MRAEDIFGLSNEEKAYFSAEASLNWLFLAHFEECAFFKGLMTRQNPSLQRYLKALMCTNDDLEQRPLSRQ